MKDHAPEYWNEKPGSLFDIRVKIDVEDVRLTEEEGMLKRVDLEKDDNAKDMRILIFRSETNYKLELRHSKYIEHLWKRS